MFELIGNCSESDWTTVWMDQNCLIIVLVCWVLIHKLVEMILGVDWIIRDQIIDVSWNRAGMQNDSEMLNEGAEGRKGYKVQAQVEEVPKDRVQKGNQETV